MSGTPNKIDAFIATLSDEVLAECVNSVLETWPKLKEPGRRVLLRRDPRKNDAIKQRIFEQFGPSRAADATGNGAEHGRGRGF